MQHLSCHGFHFLAPPAPLGPILLLLISRCPLVALVLAIVLAPLGPILLLLTVFDLYHQTYAHALTHHQLSSLPSSPFFPCFLSFCLSPYHLLPLMTMMTMMTMMMMMMMDRMTSLLSLLTVPLQLSYVPSSPYFPFSSPLCLCPYHPSTYSSPCAPFSPSPSSSS